MTTELKSKLRAFMKAIWNKGDFSQLAAYVAPQYDVKNDPGDAWEGQQLDHAAFEARVRYSRSAFPDLRFEIEEMVAEGERVLAAWTMSGTHLGDLPQLPATGRSFAIAGMTIYYFEDGKVCGHRQAYDRLGFLGQIGFLG